MSKQYEILAEKDTKLDEVYLLQWFMFRQAVMGLGEETELSRRELPDVISIAFARHGQVDFKYRDESLYELPDFDDVLVSNDLDLRWVSRYVATDKTGHYPQQFSHTHKRLRILNLYLKIAYPHFIPHLQG